MQYNAMQIQHGRNKMRHHLLCKEMWGKAFIYVQKREGVKNGYSTVWRTVKGGGGVVNPFGPDRKQM